MDLQLLLAPISVVRPCGPNLEYDPDFIALEQASQGKPERQTGQVIIPAEEPNWVDVEQRAIPLFSRTKDLRVAVHLLRALIHRDGMPGFASGLKLLHALLTSYWESVHPELDPDDDNDPAMRLNALAPLADPETVQKDVRNVNFVSTGSHARLSVKDVLIEQGKFPASGAGAVPTRGEIEEVLCLPENASSVAAIGEALTVLNGIHIFLGEKVGYDRIPDLQPLRDMLKTVAQLYEAKAGAAAMPIQDSSTAVSSNTEIDGRSIGIPAGAIQSREEAVRLLDKICEFIERTEPANPAPLFIRRGQRLMTKNFVEIIQDLAPDSLNQIKQITGLEIKKP
ncbi:MAG TPA: type VI secretion system protein TssA [Nitrosospira sp.]|nr:type VI secretion system protein TssA [Nitrosospira sp.]